MRILPRQFFLGFFAWTALLGAPDRIVLHNGAVLEGEILSETADSIEIRIGEGQVVGVAKKSAKEIFRDPNRSKSPAPRETPSDASKVFLGEERFLVEDREGRTVAALRLLARREETSESRPQPGFVLEEHWLFPEAKETLRVSWIETLSEDLSPRELLYREETGVAGKLVLAKRAGERLEIEISGGPEKRKLTLPWDADCRFPLAARAQWRDQAQRATGEQSLSIFDPRLLAFDRRRVVFGERRAIEWQGEEKMVFFFRATSESGGAWEDWIDARHGLLRRECNGPDLVARHTKTEDFESFLKGEKLSGGERMLVDPLGRFRLRLADSHWKHDPGADAGSVLLLGKDGEKAAVLVLDGAARADSAASRLGSLERRLQSSLENYKREEKLVMRTLQGRESCEFAFTFEELRDAQRGLALIVPAGESTLAILYSFSAKETLPIPAEWERLLARVDLP